MDTRSKNEKRSIGRYFFALIPAGVFFLSVSLYGFQLPEDFVLFVMLPSALFGTFGYGTMVRRNPVLFAPELSFFLAMGSSLGLIGLAEAFWDRQMNGFYSNEFFVLAFLAMVLSVLYVFSAGEILAVFWQKRFSEKSWILRAVRRKTADKGLRERGTGYLLAALFFAAASSLYISIVLMLFDACPPVFALFTGLGSLFFYAYALMFGKHGAFSDLDRLLELLYESGDEPLTLVNPLGPSSSFYDLGETVARMNRRTEEGIEKGIAGEKLKVELITNVSHDLRTPLTSVIGYSEELDRMALPEDAKEISGNLLRKARYLKDLVNDLFDLSKTASGAAEVERDVIDLNRLARQTVGEFQDRIQASGFEVVQNLTDADARVLTDGTRTHRVLQNLLDNALKYAQPGTRIFVSTSRDGEKISLEVMNTSAYPLDPGIDLTERFTRGENARTGEGSGLGLAIAKTYTEAGGGSFDIRIRGDLFEAIMSFEAAPEEAVLQSSAEA